MHPTTNLESQNQDHLDERTSLESCESSPGPRNKHKCFWWRGQCKSYWKVQRWSNYKHHDNQSVNTRLWQSSLFPLKMIWFLVSQIWRIHKHVGNFCKNCLRFTMQLIVSISSTSFYLLGWRKQLRWLISWNKSRKLLHN